TYFSMATTIGKIAVAAAAGIAAFSLLLLIISVATPVWLDAGSGNTIGLFRQCVGSGTGNSGCVNQNRDPQAGLSVFGLLLLAFAIIVAIASIFIEKLPILYGALGLLYFSSVFVMSAYATFGVYSRDPGAYFFPYLQTVNNPYTNVGYSYNLCVASHYFLWTALTLLAFGAGYKVAEERSATT
ncbi:unnamed protein product, partial [Rotaria socialis]